MKFTALEKVLSNVEDYSIHISVFLPNISIETEQEKVKYIITCLTRRCYTFF